MTEAQIEEALSIYNNTYCDERKGHASGGNAERTAMRAVLDWAIELCAKACDDSIPLGCSTSMIDVSRIQGIKQCAAAIRARSQEGQG